MQDYDIFDTIQQKKTFNREKKVRYVDNIMKVLSGAVKITCGAFMTMVKTG